MGRVVNGQSYRDRVKSSLKVEQQLGSQAQNARRPSASGEAAPAGGGSSPLQKRCFVPSTPSPMMRPSSFPEQGGGQVPNFSLGGSMLPPGYGEVAFGELGFGDVGFGDVSTPGFDAQMDQQMAPQCYFPTMAYDPSSGVYVPCGWMLVDCNEYDPMGQAQIIDNSCYDMPIKGVEQASPSPLLRMLTEDQNLMQTPLPEQEPQQQIDAEQWPLALEQGGQHSGQEASWEIEAAEQQQAQSRDSSYPQTQGQDDSRRRPKGRGKGRGREEKERSSEALCTDLFKQEDQPMCVVDPGVEDESMQRDVSDAEQAVAAIPSWPPHKKTFGEELVDIASKIRIYKDDAADVKEDVAEVKQENSSPSDSESSDLFGSGYSGE
eukprot:gnl/TRDRNA2_/TRDRNA2_171709_c0_seq8.p1 gnl/TRDRNA2_/TRDRNA2_171709_c0~~gnl/TRDRNA2_/TRDRNA2_171709_c0_seq8.p1  ORF type:complete len:395 (-),score=89.97 gnl/TRDRNA2_/TRDRNA2_171709_c0_seq8:74-1204(-)